MVNWKTTIGGIVNAIAAVLAIIGVTISPENQQAIIAGAVALATVGSTIVGLFAKDSNVTGGTTPATTEAAERVNR